MGIVTDKLNELYAQDSTIDAVFELQKITSALYEAVQTANTAGGNLYPTGDETFDGYFLDIAQAFVDFRSTLEQHLEFINWTEPV